MEPISIFGLFFVAIMGMQAEENRLQGVEISNLTDEKQSMEIEIDELEAWNLRMSGAIASIFAREKVNHDMQQEMLDEQNRKIQYLMKE